MSDFSSEVQAFEVRVNIHECQISTVGELRKALHSIGDEAIIERVSQDNNSILYRCRDSGRISFFALPRP